MDIQALSGELRRRRTALRLSLSQVARRADTSPATLSRYEKGWPRFELYTLQKLATALRARLDVRLAPLPQKPPTVNARQVVARTRRLFWDIPLTPKTLAKHPRWFVERVLELGNLEDVKAVRGLMGQEVFLRIVARAGFSSPKTKRFWEQMLAKEGMTCTRKSSQGTAGSS